MLFKIYDVRASWCTNVKVVPPSTFSSCEFFSCLLSILLWQEKCCWDCEGNSLIHEKSFCSFVFLWGVAESLRFLHFWYTQSSQTTSFFSFLQRKLSLPNMCHRHCRRHPLKWHWLSWQVTWSCFDQSGVSAHVSNLAADSPHHPCKTKTALLSDDHHGVAGLVLFHQIITYNYFIANK